MYVPNDFWKIITELNAKIDEQNQLIYSLKSTIDSLERMIAEQISQSRVAEKIEYNFDQLKIETLEGTLNIGMTPNQALPFEHIDLPNEQNEMEQLSPFEQIVYQQLTSYIRDDIPKEIKQFSEKNHLEISDEWIAILLYELNQQLPNRIQHHTKYLQDKKRLNLTEDHVPLIVNHIKNELQQGLLLHLNRLKENEDES